MTMTEQEIRYALAKQVDTAYAIETNYGCIELDEELSRVVAVAVRTVLELRLRAVVDDQIIQAVEQHGGSLFSS